MIGTPAYAGLSPGYVTSLVSLTSTLSARGISARIHFVTSNAIIELARAEIVAAFLASDCTHLLMVDSDITFPADLVRRMLMRRVDFIAAAAPKRALQWEAVADAARKGEPLDAAGATFAVGFASPKLEVTDGTTRVEGVGTAFMLVTRACLERVVSAHPELALSSGGGAIFHPMVEGGKFVGEDIAFCRRWRALGGDIWLMLDAELAHAGSFEYRGNIASHLT